MSAPSSPPDFRAAFDRTCALSQFVARVAAASPEIVAELASRAARPYGREEMRAWLAPGEDLADRLRGLRKRAMVALAHRDLNGLAPLDEVFDTMTALAEECIGAAALEAHRRAVERFGEPARNERLAVAGLGKLGGCELNVSSDVDLVFLYGSEGETAGARPASHHEFHALAARTLIALLAEVTAQGQAFRVDMRLRPFGDSGPLVTSLSALEDYFIGHARPWERYAWMKARIVAGPDEGFAGRVEPFVYRRYLDYGMLEALREMHGRIAEAAESRRKADDIKVGSGGIREVEFAVQLFQMVRGGRDSGLRTPSTRAALGAIEERGLLDSARVRDLRRAYAFLRKLEHRLQYYDDQQTQALPREEAHRAAIASAMDFPDWGALAARLAAHRAKVQATFESLFEKHARAPAAARLDAALFDPQAPPDPEALGETLQAAGIAESAAVAQRLLDYTRSRRYGSMSAAARAKVERLLPALVAATAAHGGTGELAGRLIALLESIDRREAYYALLVEQPQVLERAAGLMARSRWAAALLARHPILLDELTRTAASFTATDWPAESAALAAECAAMDGDVERILDHLRHFKQRQVLRFTIADIEGELPVMALSDELSALADTILEVTVVEAMKNVGLDLGLRRMGDDDTLPAVPGFCVVGYGKLGGKELGYGSDLDVVFLYDESRSGQAESLARAAQRVNNWMTALTPAGVLYEIDLRLRPDGIKGLMVGSIAAFRDYQLQRAWTWEHQALTRARACAGDRALGERFERLRDELLAMPRSRDKLFPEIVAMRERMRKEHKRDLGDLKHVAGGIIDLEFCVQALVLLHGPAHPALRENKGNHTLLKRAGELGLIDDPIARAAADAYLAMRRRAHDAALNDEDGVTVASGDLQAERAAVKALWQQVFG